MIFYHHDDVKNLFRLEHDLLALLTTQRIAFIDTFHERYETPHPILLNFHEEDGDCHIKVGYKKCDDMFAIKVASGFYQNHVQGLPNIDGAFLICSQKTGRIKAILHDGGYLTTLRTALAAGLACQMTPWKPRRIGILGTGSVAQQLIKILPILFPNAMLGLWGRDHDRARAIAGTYVDVAASIDDVIEQSDVIITATPTKEPIIKAPLDAPQKHVIALGADDQCKNECAAELFGMARTVIVDDHASASCVGDTFHAIKKGHFSIDKAVHFGAILDGKHRLNKGFIITSLRGIPAQDIEIARFVLESLEHKNP